MIAEAACKICGGCSPLLDVLDFNRSCEEARGRALPLAGVPVWYRRCGDCGFIFTDFVDAWSPEDFAARIYNETYMTVDPDFAEVRPRFFADRLGSLFGDRLMALRILDYGAGSGALADRLRERCAEVVGYDPFAGRTELRTRPSGRFDLLLAFEVFEHAAFPRQLVEDLSTFLADPGLMLFSTSLSDGQPTSPRLTWPYAAPRNGHVSLYSARSLQTLFVQTGHQVGSFDLELHAAFRTVPDFARHLFVGAAS